MKQIITFLKQLDLSTTEIKIYLKLLSSGPLTVSELAEKIKMNRTAAYTHIDSLLQKGLVSKNTEKTTMIEACPPEDMYNLVDAKMHTVKSIQYALPSIVNTLTNISAKNPSSKKFDIKYFRGRNSAQKIYLEALSAKELRTYIKIRKDYSLFPNNAAVFANAMTKNPKMIIKEIIYNIDTDAIPSKQSRSFTKQYFYKYLPTNQKLSSEDILLYGGKVAIINLGDDRSTILLQSQDLYNNFIEVFDFLWNVLPEPNNR